MGLVDHVSEPRFSVWPASRWLAEIPTPVMFPCIKEVSLSVSGYPVSLRWLNSPSRILPSTPSVRSLAGRPCKLWCGSVGGPQSQLGSWKEIPICSLRLTAAEIPRLPNGLCSVCSEERGASPSSTVSLSTLLGCHYTAWKIIWFTGRCFSPVWPPYKYGQAERKEKVCGHGKGVDTLQTLCALL